MGPAQKAAAALWKESSYQPAGAGPLYEQLMRLEMDAGARLSGLKGTQVTLHVSLRRRKKSSLSGVRVAQPVFISAAPHIHTHRETHCWLSLPCPVRPSVSARSAGQNERIRMEIHCRSVNGEGFFEFNTKGE